MQQSVLGGEVKTIKSGKRSAVSSDASEKQIIVYTSACIESARIEKCHSDKQLNENCSSHTWNEEDDALDHQLEKLGAEKVFSEHSEHVKRDLRAYIEEWERFSMNKYDQRSRTRFLVNYGGLSNYDIDMENRYSIYDK